MPRGGKRPGAGRKPKTVYQALPTSTPPDVELVPFVPGETAVMLATRTLTDALPQLLWVALDLAISERNPRMVVYCIDRLLGSPVQPIDLDVKRMAARLAARMPGANPDWLIRRAEEIAAMAADQAPQADPLSAATSP